jgi:hypothetical protein
MISTSVSPVKEVTDVWPMPEPTIRNFFREASYSAVIVEDESPRLRVDEVMQEAMAGI